MLIIRVVDQLGNPHEGFIPRFYFGKERDREEINIVHKYENKENDAYYLQFNNLAKVTHFGFRIEPNQIGNAVYKESNTIDLINTDNSIFFLEQGKTHFVEVTIEKSLTKDAFSFINPKKVE